MMEEGASERFDEISVEGRDSINRKDLLILSAVFKASRRATEVSKQVVINYTRTLIKY